MTSPYDAAFEALLRQRELIDQAISVLEQLRGGVPPVTVKVVMPERRKETKAAPVERRRNVASSDANATLVMDAMKKTTRPVTVAELERETQLSRYLLGKSLDALGASKRLVITGESSAKRVSLPANAAKGAL